MIDKLVDPLVGAFVNKFIAPKVSKAERGVTNVPETAVSTESMNSAPIQATDRGSVEQTDTGVMQGKEQTINLVNKSEPSKPFSQRLMDAGVDTAVGYAQNKADEALYGTKAEQAKKAMDVMYGNTTPHERLAAGGGGAPAMTSAERVARVNANSAKKVASINQNTGAIARAQARMLNQKTQSEREITRQEAWKADNMDQVLGGRTDKEDTGSKHKIDIGKPGSFLHYQYERDARDSNSMRTSMPPLPNKY